MLKTSVYPIIALWIFIALAMVLSLYGSWCGLGLTYDSHDYLAAASSFRESGRLLNANRMPFVFHTPLFPIMMSIFNQNPVLAALVLTKAFFLATLLWLVFWFRQFIEHPWIHLLCCIAIGLNVGLLMIHNFLWSESLFLFLFVGHNYFLIRFLEKKSHFWLVIVFALLLGITRNAGFFIILISSIAILFFGGNKSRQNSIVYLVLGAVGFASWNLHLYYVVDQGDMFATNEFLSDIGGNFFNYASILSQWILPTIIPLFLRIAFCAIAIFIIVLKAKDISIPWQARVFIIQFVAYVFIMIITLNVDKYEIERLVAIVLPWFFIGVFMVLDCNRDLFPLKFRTAALALLIMWVVYIGLRGIKNTLMWHDAICQREIGIPGPHQVL